ncbi:PilN domain-containing protein [Acetobacter sicerae]|uniref:PilN domain-containing protein n=1 Tax=Acetobacter sicerae TaxID=85325 RepID=A0ABS8VSU9_9PROT|nr:PilN domain-containing protein [Acetobacter sicerae]
MLSSFVIEGVLKGGADVVGRDSILQEYPMNYKAGCADLLSWYKAQIFSFVDGASKNGPFGKRFYIVDGENHHNTGEISVDVYQGQTLVEKKIIPVEQFVNMVLKAQKRGRQSASVLVCVPPQNMLATEISLPHAAETDLHSIMTFEIERITPFSPQELFWSLKIIKKLTEAGKILVTLTYVPKRKIASLVEALEQHGVQVRALVASQDQNSVRPEDWLRVDMLRPKQKRVPVVSLCVAGCLFVLLGGLFWQQYHELSVTNKAISTLQPIVKKVQAVRSHYEELVSGPENLRRQIAGNHATAQTLRQLSEQIPDDTYLTALTIQGQHLEIQGISHSAARLLETLDRGGMLKDPVFDGPIVRSPDNAQDMFTLQAGFSDGKEGQVRAQRRGP